MSNHESKAERFLVRKLAEMRERARKEEETYVPTFTRLPARRSPKPAAQGRRPASQAPAKGSSDV